MAIDHRGHGRGLDTRDRFRLADCADDVAAVADHLGLERFIPVGYSMGGPVAQLTWHRHRPRVAGLVLAATAAQFAGRRGEAAWFRGVDAAGRVAGLVPERARRRARDRLIAGRRGDTPIARWAENEVRLGDPRAILQAGGELGRFDATAWLGTIDVPTAVIVTTRDRVVPPDRQRHLVAAVPDATAHELPIEHSGCVTEADTFVPGLVRACRDVATRSAMAPVSNTLLRASGN